MRSVSFTNDVRTATHEGAAARGYAADIVDGVLVAIAQDIGRTYDELILRPPGHPERRTYVRRVEALGTVEAVSEIQGDEVVVIRLRVGAFT